MKYVWILVAVIALAAGGYYLYSKKHEHPGTAVSEHGGKAMDEHPGSETYDHGKDEEHPGEESADEGEQPGEENEEHPGDETEEHPGDTKLDIQKPVTASDIKSAMRSYIQSKTDTKTLEGTFKIYDEKDQKWLTLKFVKIHDPVRILKNKGYFACTDFEVVGEPGRLYDLDFWLNPENGKLAVTEEKVHKHPADNQGNKTARYTFRDDEIVDLP